MKAMILAAGEGTRLRPLTATLPKPLVPIVGTPLLEHTLYWLAGQGVTEAAINLYHRPQAIPDYFGSEFQGIRLHYFYEDELRGTSGGLKSAEAVFRNDPFFVIYGDNLVQTDLGRLLNFHIAHEGLGTIGLFQHPNPTAAGIIGIEADGRITRFVEKPPVAEIFSNLANAGVYVLDPAILSFIPKDRPSDFGRDIFPQLLAEGKALHGAPLGGYLQDTGTPASYRQANWDCLAGKTGRTFDTPDLWIAPSAQVGCDVVFVGRNIVGASAIIGDGAVITDSILWDGAALPPHDHLTNTILAPDGRRAEITL
jgi:NDP-sugar pyrophosphorylase family protein